MEDFNSKYSGEQVEALLDQVASGGEGGGITVETDPIFSASPAASITEDDKEAWNNKVSYSVKDFRMVNSDGFMTSEGDGFVFPNTPAAQAEQGFVLATLDDIPNAITEADITAMGFTKNTGTYSKPSGGIPQSDLAEEVKGALRKAEQYTGTVTEIKVNGNNIGASGGVVDLGNLGTYSKPSTGIPKTDLDTSVQASLGKADTAVQPADIKDAVYIADFTMYSLRTGMNSGTDVDCNMQALVTAMNANKVILVREDENLEGVHVLNGFAEDLLYFSIVDSSGNILWCDGTDYIYSQGINAQTLHLRSWDSKQDTLVSGENIKTINGQSILGSGDITISGGSGEQGPQGPQGDKGDKGDKGDTGVGVQSVKQTTISNTDGGSNVVTVTLTNGATSTFTVKNGSKGSNGTNGTNGKDGADGATFTPSVDSAGNLSWTNNKGLTNPPTVNIKGPKGDKGDAGEGGGGSSGSGAYSEVNHGTSDTTFTLTPNAFHVWDEVANLTLTLGSETSGVANEFLFQFTSGTAATTLSLPDDIKWTSGETPLIGSNKIYQVSILKGLGSVLEFSNKAPKIDNLLTYASNNISFQYPVASEVTVVFYGRPEGASASSAPTNVTLVYAVGEQTKGYKYIFNIVSITPSEDDTYNYLF